MKKKGRLGVFGTLFLVSALAVSSVLLVYVSLAPAADEAYPAKPIRLIIGGKAGDAYDINGRRFAPTLAKQWGVNVLPVDQLGPMSTDFFDAVHEATSRQDD
jgi:tripartite-type tricarboxylate transporter receptor subunit TctC